MKAQRGSAGVGRRERARDTDTAGDARRDTHSAQHTPPTTTENVQKPRSHTRMQTHGRRPHPHTSAFTPFFFACDFRSPLCDDVRCSFSAVNEAALLIALFARAIRVMP